MRDLIADGIEAAGAFVGAFATHGAKFLADAITERGNGFSDDEAGDYLRCAGADALAESFGRLESDGPDASEAFGRCTCPCINCSNQAHWLCHGDGVEIDTVLDQTPSATGKPAEDGPAGGGERRPHSPHGATDSPAGPLTYEMTLNRMQRLENGAWLAFSDDFPGKSFLIIQR